MEKLREKQKRKFENGQSSSNFAAVTSVNTKSQTKKTMNGIEISPPKKEQIFNLNNVQINSILTSDEEEKIKNIKTVEPGKRKQISNISEYKKYHQEFFSKYPVYSMIDKKLNENEKLFNELVKFHNSSINLKEKEKTWDIMQQLFEKRKEEIEYLTKTFNSLHADLREIKELVSTFVKKYKATK